jgi:hypothetical protein
MRPALIPAALVLALAVGGCSLGGSSSASNGGFTGVKGNIAVTLNNFSSDGSSNNATDICQNVLATAALARIARAGNCKTIITNQLKTVDDFTLAIENIVVTGASAVANVQTKHDGKKVIASVTLRHEKAGWRVESFGQ